MKKLNHLFLLSRFSQKTPLGLRHIMNLGIAVALLFALPASAQSPVLYGAMASRMTTLLKDAGIKEINGKIISFEINCEAFGFGENFCQVATEPNDPASHRVTIPSESSGEFWSLLKRAGLKQFISDVSDGTAGHWVILASKVTCKRSQKEKPENCIFVR